MPKEIGELIEQCKLLRSKKNKNKIDKLSGLISAIIIWQVIEAV